MHNIPDHSLVVAKVVEKKVNSRCEACGHDTWQIPTQEGDDGKALTLGMLTNGGFGMGVMFIPMICRSCGFTRLFHQETLMGPKNE